MKDKVWLSSPHMGSEEAKFVQQAFDTNWVSPVGPHLDAFENAIASYNDIGYCAALSSGTAAIHLALVLLGVQDGDEVICSSFTFSGSCNPIIYQRATPVFIDSEAETWNMDPHLLREAIEDRIKKGKKPKAIILVHLYGTPAKIDRLISIAREFEIPVIEDAAEALGAHFQGKKLGTYGDLGVFSFNGNKIITTSGGGALVSERSEWIQKAKFLATQARDPAPHYEHTHIGYNYRLSNICAAIGRGQMMVLNERIRQRRAVFMRYYRAFSGIEGFSFQSEPAGGFSNRWLTSILVNPELMDGINREDIRLMLEKENIESRPLWKPMHLQPVFRDAPAYVSGVSESLFRDGLCLPSGSNMSEDTQERVMSLIMDRIISLKNVQ